MTDQTDFLSDLGQEDFFEKEMRGYSRRQVDEFVARSRSQTRDLEEQLSRALDEMERLRLELSSARQAASDKPAQEEISERMGQILKLADDEAKAQKNRAEEEIEKFRNEAKLETDKFRAEAREQSDRMLSAAQEQAKQLLDEATARATAIHDGAERRLNLLTSRHTEAIRRLTEIRDVVTTLVAGEAARGSMEEEVAKSVASAIGNAGGNGGMEGRHGPGVSGPPARPRTAVPAGVKPGPGQPVTAGKLPPDEPRQPAARPQAASRPPAH